MQLSRRTMLGGLISAAPLLSAVPALAGPAGGSLVARARAELGRLGSAIPERDLVGVADFSNGSDARRFHLIDMRAGRVDSYLVAHGRGSDPDHTGFVKRFSNAPGSYASSEGAYRTAGRYTGKHGPSMRLDGLDPTNCNALPRDIVVHGAWYVSPDMVRQHGKLGRSEGCFAVSEADIDTVLTRLGPGRLLICGRYG
jgi:hypothetical protein